MVVKVLSDLEHVVVNIVHLSSSSHDVNVVHLCFGHVTEGFKKIVVELLGVFVLMETSESVTEEPNVHVGDRVLNMEIVWNVHGLYEFPRIKIHKNSL